MLFRCGLCGRMLWLYERRNRPLAFVACPKCNAPMKVVKVVDEDGPGGG